MKLKAIVIAGLGLLLAGVSQANAQQVHTAPPMGAPAKTPQVPASMLASGQKAQMEGLLNSLENGQIPNSDLAGAAQKATSYINEDINSAEKTLDKANSQDAKKLEGKKALLKKAEVLAGKYSSGKETKRDALVELLKQYIKTL